VLWLGALIHRRATAARATMFVWLLPASAVWCIGSAFEGLSHSLVEKIFNPFFTTKHSGHGLGLAAVQGIVRGHRGALRYQERSQSRLDVPRLVSSGNNHLDQGPRRPPMQPAQTWRSPFAKSLKDCRQQ